MKKITIALLIISLVSFESAKTLKVGYDKPTWDVYFRNIERLNQMAGRNVTNSELLLATKDTIQWFTQSMYVQVTDTTMNKK